jgi:hypothetical protein
MLALPNEIFLSMEDARGGSFPQAARGERLWRANAAGLS